MSALCAAAVASWVTVKIMLRDVWLGGDYRGLDGIYAFSCVAALFAVYVTLRLSVLFSPSVMPVVPPKHRLLHPPVLYFILFLLLLGLTLNLCRVNLPSDYSVEPLFIIALGLTSLCSLPRSLRVCQRTRDSLIPNALLFIISMGGLLYCCIHYKIGWFSEIAWAVHSPKPWLVFFTVPKLWLVFTTASLASGVTLLVSLLRKPQAGAAVLRDKKTD